MSTANILLYGANGYTARIIMDFAKKQKIPLILAGRTEKHILKFAKKYKLEYRVFSLDNHKTILENLKGIKVLLNCAGPFMYTFKPLIKACLEASVDYVDITGEIPIFESAVKLHQEAIKSKIMIMPGAGFDIVPTDCLAMYLKQKMPRANSLELAFAALGGGISHGTASTMLQSFQGKSMIRKNGKLKITELFDDTKRITYSKKLKDIESMSIPWGDVSTAYYTTGIENIKSYVPLPVKKQFIRDIFKKLTPMLQKRFFQKIAQKFLDIRLDGPSFEKRQKAKTFIVGEVQNAQGKTFKAGLVTPEGYTLTALTALDIAHKASNGNKKNGFHTPAKVYGADYVLDFKGVKRVDMT